MFSKRLRTIYTIPSLSGFQMEKALAELRRHRQWLLEEMERKANALTDASQIHERREFREWVYDWIKVIKDLDTAIEYLKIGYARTH